MLVPVWLRVIDGDDSDGVVFFFVSECGPGEVVLAHCPEERPVAGALQFVKYGHLNIFPTFFLSGGSSPLST